MCACACACVPVCLWQWVNELLPNNGSTSHLGEEFHMGIDGLCVFDPRTRDTQLFVSRTHLGDFQVGSRAYIFSDNSDGKALVVVSYEPQDPENQWIAHVLLMKEQYAILMQQKVRACVRACVRRGLCIC